MERDLRNYETNTSLVFPAEWKIPLLLQLMPASHQKELQMKYTMGERDFSKMVSNITGFATEARILENRGRKDMDADLLARETPEDYTEEDWTAHWNDLQAQLSEFEGYDLDWLGKGGKKGGGKSWQVLVSARGAPAGAWSPLPG